MPARLSLSSQLGYPVLLSKKYKYCLTVQSVNLHRIGPGLQSDAARLRFSSKMFIANGLGLTLVLLGPEGRIFNFLCFFGQETKRRLLVI